MSHSKYNKTSGDIAILATKGLQGWTVRGKSAHYRGTYSTGPYAEMPDCQYIVDMSAVYESKDMAQNVHDIWRQPNLDLSLPDDNVRNMFEGCIGCSGTTIGHLWDGKLDSLTSSDSVGVHVYLKVLESAGGIRVK